MSLFLSLLVLSTAVALVPINDGRSRRTLPGISVMSLLGPDVWLVSLTDILLVKCSSSSFFVSCGVLR